MPLVPAKCPECGGNINIDSEKRAAICEFCKQPFVVEEAINNFNTTYNITNNTTNEIKADVLHIHNFVSNEISNKICSYRIKIDRAMSDNDEKKIGDLIEEISIDKEKNINNISLNIFYYELLIKVYNWVIDSKNSVEFSRYAGRKIPFDRILPIKRILEQLKVLMTLNVENYEKYKTQFSQLINKIYSYITTPVETNNSAKEEVLGFLQDIYLASTSFLYYISDETLAYDLIKENAAIQSMGIDLDLNQFTTKECWIPRKNGACGVAWAYGRVLYMSVTITAYDCCNTYYKPILISNCLGKEDIKAIKIKCCKERKKHVCEDKRKELNFYLSNSNSCALCRNKLSYSGKCKTKGCSYYKKSIRDEIARLDIEITKLSE